MVCEFASLAPSHAPECSRPAVVWTGACFHTHPGGQVGECSLAAVIHAFASIIVRVEIGSAWANRNASTRVVVSPEIGLRGAIAHAAPGCIVAVGVIRGAGTWGHTSP